MLDGLFMLLGLSVVMALASFLAGALPLSMSLSQSQLRLISTIGMGLLVGTSLIVIIPEGIEAVYTAGIPGHSNGERGIQIRQRGVGVRWLDNGMNTATHALISEGPLNQQREVRHFDTTENVPHLVKAEAEAKSMTTSSVAPTETSESTGEAGHEIPPSHEDGKHHDASPPTFYVGLSLIMGFVLMFLIDKLPRHASENLQSTPVTRHISLDNLSRGLHSFSNLSVEEEQSETFLQSLTPTAKQSRSLATTTGLVIHAAADGIAMGASASTANTKLGFIIFLAIMVHKAPAAFGLTSVLLKQGLSKRATRGHLIIFSLAAPFGALATWLLVNVLGGNNLGGEDSQWWTGMLLLFSAGTFLYVAMQALQEDAGHDHSSSNGYAEGGGSQRKQPKPQMRDTVAAVGGMLIPLLTQLGHHH